MTGDLTRIAALLTTHERRDTTLACLERLAAQTADVDLEIVVVDAASTDGTADAVRAAHPAAIVQQVGDDVFWNRGMRMAWETALAMAQPPDAVLWLNDDTLLDPDALTTLLDCHASVPTPAIVVGTTRDPQTSAPTYGGVVRQSSLRPLAHTLVHPAGQPQRCDTMNGNVVLVPRAVSEQIGLLDPGFVHGMGDFDYGHRARSRGIQPWVAPGTVGTCAKNDLPPANRSVADELRRLRRPTGLPPRDFARLARRWAGPLWPIYWASPYVRRLSRRLVGR